MIQYMSSTDGAVAFIVPPASSDGPMVSTDGVLLHPTKDGGVVPPFDLGLVAAVAGGDGPRRPRDAFTDVCAIGSRGIFPTGCIEGLKMCGDLPEAVRGGAIARRAHEGRSRDASN
jgi:hypothetical protein